MNAENPDPGAAGRAPEAPERAPQEGNGIYDILQSVIFVFVLAMLVFTFLGRQTVVVGESMYPTLRDGERLVLTRLGAEPTRGDIVLIRKAEFMSDSFVKRIIATAGQTVDIDFEKGVVYVDGEALDEPYTAEPTYAREHFEGPVTVPEGCVFVMGDNRNNSKDSRWNAVGCVDTRCILGKVICRIMPLQKFGAVS